MANKITSVPTELHLKSPNESYSPQLHSKDLHSQNNNGNNEIEEPKKRYISPKIRQPIIGELRVLIINLLDNASNHQISHLNLEQKIGLK